MTATTSSVERRSPEPPTRQERIPQAILYMVSAGAIFSFSSAASKWLVATYPVGEVLFSRVFVSLILFSAFALPTTGMAVFATRRPGAHVLRSMSQFISQTLLLIAWIAWREPTQILRVIGSWRQSALPGLTGAAASAGWMTAMTLEPAAHVRMIGLLEVIFSYAVTVFWFREQPTVRELGATALIVAGIVLLLASVG